MRGGERSTECGRGWCESGRGEGCESVRERRNRRCGCRSAWMERAYHLPEQSIGPTDTPSLPRCPLTPSPFPSSSPSAVVVDTAESFSWFPPSATSTGVRCSMSNKSKAPKESGGGKPGLVLSTKDSGSVTDRIGLLSKLNYCCEYCQNSC